MSNCGWLVVVRILNGSWREIVRKATCVKVRDAIRVIESDGWKLARTRRSHRQYRHPLKPGTVTVAGHPFIDLDPKTQVLD